MPPNSRGGAFVRDPSLAEESEVTGRIKLKFRDTTGESIIATRTIRAIQHRTKIETKTLENIIEHVTSAGDVSTGL